MKYRIASLPEVYFPQSTTIEGTPLKLFDGYGKEARMMIQGFDTITGEVRVLCTDLDGKCILDASKNVAVSKHYHLKPPLTVSK